VGKGTKSQFITGQCLSKADCASNCCVAQAGGVAQCKAEILTGQQGLSCDFRCGAGASPAASRPAASQPAPAAPAQPPANAGSGSCAVNTALAGSQNVGKKAASQFITGQCTSRADCASNCCVAQAGGVARCKAELLTNQQGLDCNFTCAA
jgi:hypothetical protein